MKEIKIGLIGFGTVGKGVYHLIKENAGLIHERKGIKVTLKTICDLDVEAVQNAAPETQVTGNYKEIIQDTDIDIVVELIGGLLPAKNIILEALQTGKSVVTANKKLLAEDGDEIFEQATKGNEELGFEAAVGGGIPCVMALQNGLVGNRIKSIQGILNGTTNYILTNMEETGMSFQAALRDAQEKGFAEADPTFDIEGYDAGHKIALLAMLAYNQKVDFRSISIEGITKISEIDIQNARAMGYCIKLLGLAKMTDNGLDIRVHPTMIPERHPLASIRNENNAILFDGDMTDPVLLYGKGAGSNPTASAVISDIVRIAERDGAQMPNVHISRKATFLDPKRRLSRYYIRINSQDSPGILAKIAGIFGGHNISIASVIQKEISHASHVPLIIMTHQAREDSLFSAIKEIEPCDFIEGNIIVIRVEDSFDSGDQDER